MNISDPSWLTVLAGRIQMKQNINRFSRATEGIDREAGGHYGPKYQNWEK